MNSSVGIVTFYDHPNYGAVLQAYALKSVLEEYGSRVSFLCDQRAAKESAQTAPAIPAEETEQEKRARRTRELLMKMARKPLEDQKRIFTEFSKRHFCQTPLTRTRDPDGQFDFFLAGSDQVWNYEIIGMDPFWFLDFAHPDKCFSYAASFGMDVLPEQGRGWYRQQLERFSRISVRERSGRGIVEELTGREAFVCPDPVFLPPVTLWEGLKAPCSEGIVVYMIEFDEVLYRAAQKHAEETGLPLIYITNVNITPNHIKRTFCTPEEWVGYVYHAREVYTNSFHGLSFSCLFHKPVHYRGLRRLSKRNNRISDLLETLGAQQRECGEGSDMFEVLFPEGWACVDEKIAGLRACGRSYLERIYALTAQLE